MTPYMKKARNRFWPLFMQDMRRKSCGWFPNRTVAGDLSIRLPNDRRKRHLSLRAHYSKENLIDFKLSFCQELLKCNDSGLKQERRRRSIKQMDA